jgi:conjugative transfer pilus assembly protein TraH
MILMSMIGSMISRQGIRRRPIPLLRKEITVEALVGSRTTSDTITVPIWRCDTTGADGCLSPPNLK